MARLICLRDPQGLTVGDEIYVFCYWKRDGQTKAIIYCIVCQLLFFESKILPWGPENIVQWQYSWGAKRILQAPFSPVNSLFSASILIKSWAPTLFLADFITAHLVFRRTIFSNVPGVHQYPREERTEVENEQKKWFFFLTYYRNSCWLHFIFSESLIPPSAWSYWHKYKRLCG